MVDAYGPPDDTDQLVIVTQNFIEAVERTDVPRLIVVGGAGSLIIPPGVTLIASGHVLYSSGCRSPSLTPRH